MTKRVTCNKMSCLSILIPIDSFADFLNKNSGAAKYQSTNSPQTVHKHVQNSRNPILNAKIIQKLTISSGVIMKPSTEKNRKTYLITCFATREKHSGSESLKAESSALAKCCSSIDTLQTKAARSNTSLATRVPRKKGKTHPLLRFKHLFSRK